MSPMGLFLQRTWMDAPGLKDIVREMCSLFSRSFSKYYGETDHAADFRKWTLPCVRHVYWCSKCSPHLLNQAQGSWTFSARLSVAL